MKISAGFFLATCASMGFAADLRTPEALAAIYLAGKTHGPIQNVERPSGASHGVPGMQYLELVEAPQRVADGCVRQRWRVAVPAARNGVPQSAEASASTEVALSKSHCPLSGYVSINPGLSSSQAIAALARLRQPGVLSAQVTLTCSAGVADMQCNRVSALTDVLGKQRPWLVGRQGQAFYVWLGERGQRVTEVRFNAEGEPSLQASRKIPAPF